MNPILSNNKDDSHSRSAESKIDPQSDKIAKMSNYIKLNMLGFQNFRLKDFKFAKQNYGECLEVAKELDEIKYAETLTNFAITNYFMGKFAECLDHLEAASRITDRYYKKGEPRNIAQIHIRVNCNLCLTCLALNKIKEAMSYNLTVIDIINREVKPTEKVILLKEVVYIYFRVESLQKYYETNQRNFSEDDDKVKNMELSNKDKDTVNQVQSNKENPTTQKLISKTLFNIHKFLKDGDFAAWVKILAEDIEHFKEISNVPGYVFALLNHTVSMYMQSGKIESAKNQINNIIKNLKISGKVKSSEKILNDWKGKIEAAMQIYKELVDLEERLSNELNNQDDSALQRKNEANRILMRVIIQHALNYINSSTIQTNKGCEDLKSQLEIALKLIEIKEIDLSNIDIFSIDSEITKSLKNLFMNLTLIKLKFTLKKFFKLFMQKTLNYSEITDYRAYYNSAIRYKNLARYKDACLNSIMTGDTLIKINFSSSGKKEHFYKVVGNDLLVYESKSSKKESSSHSFLRDIKQIKFGVKSQNLKNRFKDFKNTNLTKPWLFLSIITTKRSIDLCLKEEQTTTDWFFGMNHLIKKNNLPVMIMTNSGFALKKFKLKLLQKLKEMIEKEDDKNMVKSIDLFVQMKKYLKTNQLGLDFISFSKVLLLYMKLFNPKISWPPEQGTNMGSNFR